MVWQVGKYKRHKKKKKRIYKFKHVQQLTDLKHKYQRNNKRFTDIRTTKFLRLMIAALFG